MAVCASRATHGSVATVSCGGFCWPYQVERMDLVGSVTGCDVIIVDDMIDTAGTLCAAADNLKANGAHRVFAFASHGLFSGPASDRIKRSTLEEVVVVNTVPLRSNAKTNDKIKMVSCCPVPSVVYVQRRSAVVGV